MARRRPRRSAGASWVSSGLLLAAIAIALGGLAPVLRDAGSWWVGTVVLAGVVLAASAVTRSVSRHRFLEPIAAAVVAVLALTGVFAGATGILVVIPTDATFAEFGQLWAAGARDIAQQAVPAEPTAGIRFLIAVGVVAVAVVADLIAHTMRLPALAGIPLLVLLLVPGSVPQGSVDPWLSALAAAAWLGMLVVGARPAAARATAGFAVVALAAALAVPLALPPVSGSAPAASGGSGAFATGLNPILTLGEDLRRGTPSLAISYRTSDGIGQYLRMTVLDDFTGSAWEPGEVADSGGDVADIGPVPGLGADIPVTELSATVRIADVLSRWLPVPYAPQTIEGLQGEWFWEPDGLTVRTESSTVQRQLYDVVATVPAPSVEQLVAAGVPSGGEFERYLALPAELPEVVATTAADVAAAASTPYEQAVALQSFFRAGDFTYSEDAPVEDGYDGSGAEVLGEFLEVRAGYCVHFSSAMAAMARTLGIPARVAVGFTPGTRIVDDGEREYRVSTDDFHAWPELYFDGIGWVRFEPTPTRGVVPSFAPLTADDPSTPDVDESVPPPPEDAEAPAPSPTPAVPDDEPDPTSIGSDPSVTARSVPWSAVVVAAALVLLLTPAGIRAGRRLRRRSAFEQGSALAAWDEVRDSALDLGLGSDDGLTARQLADSLGERLDERSLAALHRLRATVEEQAYSSSAAAAPDVADLDLVLRGLRRGVGPVRAAAGWIAPRSLVRAWLPVRADA